MGPLVPYGIISGEFNFIIAIILGIGFGFSLEQAGFGSSRKLAGVFYGYDFVVLRVFFTAAITAMLGLILGNHFGIIDVSMVYVNPTFLWSTIVGGAIMGVGFVIGGFCPGTSLTAAASGKIDAMFFLGGIAIGIFIFAEGYPAFEALHTGYALGPIKVYNSLGMSQGLFAFMLIIVAIIAFAVTRKIENKINGIKATSRDSIARSGFAAAMLVVLGLVVLFIPEQRVTKGNTYLATQVLSYVQNPERFIETDELAFNLMHDELAPTLIDVRTPEEFADFSLPYAINIPLQEILEPRWRSFFTDKKEVILYSNSGIITEDAYVLLNQADITNIRVLKGGLNEFFRLIFATDNAALAPTDPVYKRKADVYNFRAKAAKYFQGIDNTSKPKISAPVKQKVISVEGGC